MVTYRFRVSFEDFDEVVREIDIKTTQTFEDLHLAIHKSTGYNSKRPSSFYVSTDNWLKGEEITHMPSERKIESGVALMANSKLKKFIEDPHQKFYYVYDFERPFDFHVELIKIILDANESLEYPYLFKSIGDAPKIFDKKDIGNVAVSEPKKTTDFDFLNELNFIPEDADDLEALTSSGINEEESSDEEDHEDEYGNEENEESDYDEEYGSDRNDDY